MRTLKTPGLRDDDQRADMLVGRRHLERPGICEPTGPKLGRHRRPRRRCRADPRCGLLAARRPGRRAGAAAAPPCASLSDYDAEWQARSRPTRRARARRAASRPTPPPEPGPRAGLPRRGPGDGAAGLEVGAHRAPSPSSAGPVPRAAAGPASAPMTSAKPHRQVEREQIGRTMRSAAGRPLAAATASTKRGRCPSHAPVATAGQVYGDAAGSAADLEDRPAGGLGKRRQSGISAPYPPHSASCQITAARPRRAPGAGLTASSPWPGRAGVSIVRSSSRAVYVGRAKRRPSPSATARSRAPAISGTTSIRSDRHSGVFQAHRDLGSSRPGAEDPA